MLGGTKRRPPTWQQALLLLIVGVVVGYTSWVHFDMWEAAELHTRVCMASVCS